MGVGATVSAVGVGADVRRDAATAFARRVKRRVTTSQCLAHLVGAVDVFVLLFAVLPAPSPAPSDNLTANLVGGLVCVPLGILFGAVLGRRVSTARMGWLFEDRPPDPAERRAVLLLPNRTFKLDAYLWALGALMMALVNVPTSVELAAHVGLTVILGGLTTCGIAYLLMERDMRPVTDMALAAGPPARPIWPGIQGRVVFAWLLATGVPLLGLILVGVHGIVGDEQDPGRTSVAVVSLAALGLLVGLTVLVAATRTVTQPLAAMRAALARVEGGDLSAELRVDDGSEVGLLQGSFNAMVGGLRERERLRGLYARQVGADVAAAALADEPVLGGESREVAVLFVDLIGSTALAQRTPPQRVVARLNAFFTVVVETIAEHGGWVNKFEGDGALCVFGAPQPHADPGGAALAAARDLRTRLRRQVPDLDAAIGVSAGPAVAGWVGARERFEYTVIGDPVNVAARLSELAKLRPERVVAAAAVLDAAKDGEGRAWVAAEPVTLRGRDEPTALAVPRGLGVGSRA